MKNCFYLLFLFVFVSCESSFLSKVFEENSEIQEDWRLEVYFSDRDEYVDIPTLNRQEPFLSLKDRFIFSRTQGEELSQGLKPLEEKGESEDFPIKIRSSCSVEKEGSSNSVKKKTYDQVSEIYRSSFSVFELILPEILPRNPNEKLYCSFVFSLSKNKRDVHYHLNQLKIQTFFDADLNLVRETKGGQTFLLKPEEVISAHRDLSKILLVNNSQKPVDVYEIWCEGVNIVKIKNPGTHAFPIFLNLLASDAAASLKYVKVCRGFSMNKGQVTGMTQSFQMDFVDGNYQNIRVKANLESIEPPSLRFINLERDFYYEKNQISPIESYFQFLVPEGEEDYSFIDIHVRTQCLVPDSSGEKIVSEIFQLPFRKIFPLMAVTPKAVFMMSTGGENSFKYWMSLAKFDIHGHSLSDSYLNQMKEIFWRKAFFFSKCEYEIELRDRNHPEISKAFEKWSYPILWSRGSYGVDQSMEDLLVANSQVGEEIRYLRLSKKRTPLSERHLSIKDKPFLSLEDIALKGFPLHLNFFDIMNDPDFWREEERLDKVSLYCKSQVDKDPEERELEVSWPYSSDQPLSWKGLLSSLFLEGGDAFPSSSFVLICRVLFYEEDIIRYFSKELSIVNYKK